MLPKDAAQRLSIAKPTLRKWAAEFAPWLGVEAGYPQAGHERRYSETDIALLQRVKSLLAERYSYEQVRGLLGDALQPTRTVQSATEHERHAIASGEQVLILDQAPEVEQLRQLLAAQQTALQSLEHTTEAQRHLIDQQRLQLDAMERGLADAHQEIDDTRADLVEQLATARAQVLKVPRWLRALLGIEV